MERQRDRYSIFFWAYIKLVGRECGDMMKANRDMLKSLNPMEMEALVKRLGDEEYTDGFSPRFLSSRQLKDFFTKLIRKQYDGAINYVQTYSGEIGQNVLNGVLSAINSNLGTKEV